MRRRWGAALLLVGGLLLAPGTGFAQEGAPGLGIRLLEAPVERAGDPRAEVYVIDHPAPSQTIRRGIAVSNGTDETVTVRLYPVAARVSGDGFHLAADESASELVDWVDVEPATLTLAPGGSRAATVTITAAPDATPGEHYGAVLAELPGDPDAPVAVTSRVGIRLYLSVGRGAEPATDFAVEALTARRDSSGRPVVQARVRNTGGRAINLTGELELSEGPGGSRAGPFPTEAGTTIAPGVAGPVTVVLDRALPAGPWRARMVARSGSLERAAEATITFPAATGGRAHPQPATPVPVGRQGEVPVLLVAGRVLLLALLALWLWVAHRRERKRREGTRHDTRGGGGAQGPGGVTIGRGGASTGSPVAEPAFRRTLGWLPAGRRRPGRTSGDACG